MQHLLWRPANFLQNDIWASCYAQEMGNDMGHPDCFRSQVGNGGVDEDVVVDGLLLLDFGNDDA